MRETPKLRLRAQVAQAAGVSEFTVSRALAGKPGVKAATRARVVAAAKELGYQPNAAASALAQRRGSLPSADLRLARIWDGWFEGSHYLQACGQLGLRGEQVCVKQFKSPREMLRVLWHRGIQGLFLDGLHEHFVRTGNPHWSEESLLQADWGRLSVVKRGRPLPRLRFHLVRHSAFDYLWLTLQKVKARGAKRVAVFLVDSGSATDDDARLAASLLAQHQWQAHGVRLEFLQRAPGQDAAPLASHEMAWLRRTGADTIVAITWATIKPLLQTGWSFPRDARFAAVYGPILSVYETMPELPRISGCDTLPTEIYRRGLRHLTQLIAMGERGFPNHPLEDVVEPVWIEGETL